MTGKPVAFDSPDHIQPHGTAHDNSVNPAFNYQLSRWIPYRWLRVLDLGCAGGGFVKSILDSGGFAVGVEGSDYSRSRRRAEWATIPEYLFTADASEPFRLLQRGKEQTEHPVTFNVITAWEFFEHIHPDKLAAVVENIQRHLVRNGLVIVSVSPNEEVIGGVRLHQTVAPRSWWMAKFAELSLVNHAAVVSYFNLDWVRGEPNAPGSFHLAMTRRNEHLPLTGRLTVIRLRSRVALRTRIRRLLGIARS